VAVKSAQILHTIDGFVVDRAQNIGPADLTIDEEKIYEVGNFESVGTVRGEADLTFSIESLDVSTEIEAILTAEDPTATVNGDVFDLRQHVPINVISPFKRSGSSFDINSGILIPYLTLESATYSFGVSDNATQSFSLRGDNMQWVNGSPMSEEFTITAGTNQSYTLSETALLYEEGADDLYVTGATACNPTTKEYRRLNFGDDYTNTATTITTIDNLSTLGFTELKVVYGTAATQTYPQTVHADTAVKPGAVRGRDIDVYIGTDAATPVFSRWRGVQSADINWSVTLDTDREFGNPRVVSQDYDVPDVNGSVTMRSRDAADLIAKIKEVTGVTNDIIGPHDSATLPLEVHISHPETGARLKTFYVPDAKFSLPGNQVAVQSKIENTFNWTSESGGLLIYAGER
jgi:hypothetical protein